MLGQCLSFDSQIDGQSQPIVFLTDENHKKEITLFSDGSHDYLNVHSGLKEEKLSFKKWYISNHTLYIERYYDWYFAIDLISSDESFSVINRKMVILGFTKSCQIHTNTP